MLVTLHFQDVCLRKLLLLVRKVGGSSQVSQDKQRQTDVKASKFGDFKALKKRNQALWELIQNS